MDNPANLGVDFVLAGRINNPTQVLRTRLSSLFALSYIYNPHNVEYPLYATWNCVLNDLAAAVAHDLHKPIAPDFTKRVINTGFFQVFPQFLVVAPKYIPPIYRLPSASQQHPDSSITSTMTIKMGHNFKRLLADFAIVHMVPGVSLSPQTSGPNLMSMVARETSLYLDKASVFLLAEEKRFPSRSPNT